MKIQGSSELWLARRIPVVTRIGNKLIVVRSTSYFRPQSFSLDVEFFTTFLAQTKTETGAATGPELPRIPRIAQGDVTGYLSVIF